MNKPFNSNDPMMNFHSNFEMEKLNSWKNKSLVEEEYFDKLRVCILQRIQMDQDFQRTTLPIHHLPNKNKRLKQYWIYTSGIAALFIMAFYCFKLSTSTNDHPIAQKEIKQTSNETKTIDTMANTKLIKEEIRVEEFKKIDSIPNKEQFEIALESITDEELEAINWELYFDESF